MKLKYLIIALAFIPFGLQSQTVEDTSADAKPCDVLLANVNLESAENVSRSKFEAALNIALNLTNKYRLVPSYYADSVRKQLERSEIAPTAKNLADELQACEIMFASVKTFKNILRVDLTAALNQNPDEVNKGTGYALMHYFNEADDKHIADPNLLEALQRAFADLKNDSLMYHDKGGLTVYPAKTLVIGGLEYKNNENLPLWEIFEKKVITSYDAAESIFVEARKHKGYVAYDLETRDSLYIMFNLIGIENYTQPTRQEVHALNSFDVEKFIIGTIQRIEEGARITMHLCNISKGDLEVIKTAEDVLKKDDIDQYREIVKKLTAGLLTES
ncbi:MAG: hypothetical protein ACLFR2_10850 [Candidatus Kapaibacterium sp.]